MEQRPPEEQARETSQLLKLRDQVEERLHVVLERLGRMVHANRISAGRILGAGLSIGLDTVSHGASTVTWTVTTILDWVDGAVARAMPHGRTKEGAIIDPFIDKANNLLALSYLALNHLDDGAFLAAAAASVALNIISQVKRGPWGEQLRAIGRGVATPEACEPVEDAQVRGITANVYGKVKQALECLAIGGMFAAGDAPGMRTTATIGLVASSALSVASTWKRGKPHAQPASIDGHKQVE
jgi:phosphatidylglycerophosphate synthase